MSTHKKVSLSEVNQSIETPNNNHFFQNLLAFLGPGTFLFGAQEKTLDQLLAYSQVFLSMALPFSIFPLIYFTSKKSLMGEFTNAKWNTFLGYGVAVILTILNFKLIIDLF